MILGESSAAGFPFEPNGGFSRFLDQRLSILYPKKKFEIVNLGIAAINSYAIMDILEDVIDQKPDLVLIYTGHNEYYGALGAASVTSIASSPANEPIPSNRWENYDLFRLLSSTILR
jgi:hypothetical protein